MQITRKEESKDTKEPPLPAAPNHDLTAQFNYWQLRKLRAEVDVISQNVRTLAMQAENFRYGVYLGYLAELRLIMSTSRVVPIEEGEDTHMPGDDHNHKPQRFIPLVPKHDELFKVYQRLAMKLKEDLVDSIVKPPSQ